MSEERKERKRRLIHINPKYGLEAAILVVAKHDYKEALLDQMNNSGDKKVNRRVRRLEKFFLSEWGQLLSHDLGELIIEKCKQEVLHEV